MSPIQQILGLDEKRAISWLNAWTKKRNYENAAKNAAKDTTPLDDCQLDALRYLGSGSEATCGVLCNSTDYSGIVPERCELFENVSLDDLWHIADCKFNIYLVLDQATLTIPDTLYLNNNSGRDDIQRDSI